MYRSMKRGIPMNAPDYKAIFFDLDGTLLPIDMDQFLYDYFESLRDFSEEHGFDADLMIKAVNMGVEDMFVTRDGRVNADRFWDTFENVSGGTRDDFEPVLMEFYQTAYTHLGDGVIPNPAALRAVQACSDKGYTLYLTTMPLFPDIAVKERLRWAGIDNPELFDRITTYDNSTTTKPDTDYWQENVDEVGYNPSDILVVGNNTREDLSCLELGCDAYLVLDWLIDPNDFDTTTVKNGTLADFAQWCEEELPDCSPDVNLP